MPGRSDVTTWSGYSSRMGFPNEAADLKRGFPIPAVPFLYMSTRGAKIWTLPHMARRPDKSAIRWSVLHVFYNCFFSRRLSSTAGSILSSHSPSSPYCCVNSPPTFANVGSGLRKRAYQLLAQGGSIDIVLQM